jgi:uncharacterized repeat protein (TIGR02543 family)
MDNWVQAASSVMLNRWAYVAGVNQSSGAMAIYLDGALVSTSTNWNIPSPNNTYNVQLGKTSSGSLYFFSGFMDEVQLANVARSADWIKLSYKNQFFSGGKDFLTVLPPVTLTYASPSITGSAGTAIAANTATLMGGVCTYSATGLPAGLSISPTTGTISGTPTAGYASSAIITAKNAAGSITFTMPITISIAAPVLTSPVNGATSQLRTPALTWGSVIGATMYRIQLSTASDLSLPAIDDSTTNLTYTPAALTGNTTWYWRVAGKNGDVFSSWSTIYSFTTIPEIPGAVTITLPINNAANVSVTPTLTWTAGTGGAADIYMVKVSTSSTFSSLVVNDSTVTTTYTLSTTLTNSTVYYWEVAGKNSTGTGVFVSSYFTTVISAPGIVTLTSPAIGETGVVLLPTLTWTAGAGGAADKYIVKVSTSSVFSTTIINDSTVNLSYTVATTLLNGTVYYWEVSGKNANSSGPNAVSIFITVAPLTPGAVTMASPFSNAKSVAVVPTLMWIAGTVGGAADKYLIKVSTNSDLTLPVINDSTVNASTSYSPVLALANGTKYYWGIAGKNALGTGVWVTDSFTTLPSYTLTITTVNGSVAKSPNLAAYDSNTVVQLTANPSVGYTFSGWSGDTTATANPITITMKSAKNITANFVVSPLHVFALASGWNMLSLNVTLLDSSVTAVFGTMHNLVIVTNNFGGIYWPAFGINTIGTVSTGQGYQVYTTASDSISVIGSPINVTSTSIALAAGWNMLAYLPNTNMPITTALAGIASQITIVNDNSGGIYWPDFGINTIGSMVVGQGYSIHMKSAAILTYP